MIQVLEPVHSDLLKAILIKKEEMIQLGMRYGLVNHRTIECSQQLDSLLNQYKNGELH
ncbi:aspartyl-phosphate phosphatase Spo0E family protein [Oceanobacillus rekensis]|uniref:aspartyl-phosphate phosphatase Spo0E family protein n=1 Tax=Oceanobacillus rekensis TaxID=937927 RepID=UPI000B432E09|nr:aspartyl-phosphate phosphatase Spo0E family protein [Oceanobacillus rekensis]